MAASLLFERDLTSDVERFAGSPSPVAVDRSCSLEAVDEDLLRAGWLGVACWTGGGEALPGLFELGRVEGRCVVEDGLLAGLEVSKFLLVEVA